MFILKYVIDTGFNIVVSNNPQTMETIIENKLISETSRIQRRGRVGRVGSGTVYYLYKKDSRKNIKSNYKICIYKVIIGYKFNFYLTKNKFLYFFSILKCMISSIG